MQSRSRRRLVLDAILGVLTGVAVAAVIIALQLRADVREARAWNTDLHNRLAARSYGEYAAFQPTAAPERLVDSGRRLVFDDTGLLEAEVLND